MGGDNRLDLANVRPGDDRRDGGGAAGSEVAEYRVSVSRRIWLAFAFLSALVLLASVGMVLTRGELAGVREALERAERRAAETDRKLQDALADKQHLMSELAVQGSLAEKSAQGEEERAAAEKHASTLAAEVRELKAQLERARKGQGDADKLRTELEAVKSELGVTLVKLAEAQAELQRLRASQQPYSQPYGQQSLPYGPGPDANPQILTPPVR